MLGGNIADAVARGKVVDHHVHLQLVDARRLAESGLGGVVDLGGNPAVLARTSREVEAGLTVRFAGAFLCAPGGYPSDRAWAPAGSVRVVVSASDAAEAVDEQAQHGASVIKVTLNTEAGPALERSALMAIVAAADTHGLEVVAHVEGDGMTQRTWEAGVAVLAHTPWSEPLNDAAVEECVRSGQRWISTLDIHRDDPHAHATALENLRRFHGAGGRVLYGTDLGNGTLPFGVNAREIAALTEAGLDDTAVVAALTDPWPDDAHQTVRDSRSATLDQEP